jgi:hypothetical protein
MACAAYDLACTWPRAGCTACSMCEGTILGLETTARYRPENPYQPARRQWGWRQAPPSAIPSDRSHLEGHGLAPASSKSVAVGCSWSATSRGRWIGVGGPMPWALRSAGGEELYSRNSFNGGAPVRCCRWPRGAEEHRL